ncbi:MAG TPA: S26 family signal peptidase [Thermoplasmata archaeon]|nr:S26 family signal peptidase [Thermoplasmata archaeon]
MSRSEDAAGGRSSGDEGEPEDGKRFAILLARDIAFAVILVAVILGAIFAYTQVWPPMVVVESDSMQHSRTRSFVGVIDTGDLVLVQAVHQASDVVTYVEGRAPGYEAYSNFGDVIIFHPPGSSSTATPVIHRALVYVIKNANQTMDVPSLAGFPANEWTGDIRGRTTTSPVGLSNFTLTRIQSWDANALSFRSVTVNATALLGSGFLTKGDHNANRDNWNGLGVGVARIVGKARGELPWFGLIKLTLAPTPACCDFWGDYAPKNSWDSLAITLVLLPLSLYLIDRTYGVGEDLWKGWRKSRKALASGPTGDGRPEEGDRPAAGPPDDGPR